MPLWKRLQLLAVEREWGMRGIGNDGPAWLLVLLRTRCRGKASRSRRPLIPLIPHSHTDTARLNGRNCPMPTIRIATRKSPLTLGQSDPAPDLLRAPHQGLEWEPVPVTTPGNK